MTVMDHREEGERQSGTEPRLEIEAGSALTDPARAVAALHHSGAKLDLKTIDLCFLAALYARENDTAQSWIEDDTVVDLFAQVCELVEPDAENVRTRATHAIQRLRDQKLLTRIDAERFVRAGDFNLTSLATGIVEFYVKDASDVLTRESLGLLTKELIAKLSEIKGNARACSSTEDWRESVIAPLRITVKDLAGGIERRQRGLDQQQQEIRARIWDLLELDWFTSVEECERLLEESASTLAELKTVLLEDTHQMRAFLQDIEQLAREKEEPAAEDAARRVTDHIDRVAAWGSARQEAWSEYYQYVHGYLRDVVRLDPSRALAERLREQLAHWTDNRFFLLAADAPTMRVLREIEARIERPAVVRPRRNRERELESISAESGTRDLEERVLAALANAPDSLANVMNEILPELEEERRYLGIGEVTALVARHATTNGARDRPWVTVPGGLEVEDWKLQKAQSQ